MPDDRNLELVSLVHLLNARATSFAEQIRAKIEASPDNTHIELKNEGAGNLAWVLETQASLIAKLVEENSEIYDQLEVVASKIESHLDK